MTEGLAHVNKTWFKPVDGGSWKCELIEGWFMLEKHECSAKAILGEVQMLQAERSGQRKPF